MTITRIEQKSEDWYLAKKGKIGGSTFKNCFKSDQLSFIDELIAQEGSDEVEETYTTPQMQRGIDLEPQAIEIYQQVRGVEIEGSFNLCLCEWSENLVLSPDGFTPNLIGGVEVKCPNTKTHVKYIRQGKIPSEYKHQVYMYFLVNHILEWLDFVSFDPRFKAFPMWIKRVHRHEIEADLTDIKEKYLQFEAKWMKQRKHILGF